MVTEDGKTRAIIAHMTLIGWIVALVMNNEKKDDFASYYIRQMLGLLIVSVACWFVGIILVFIPFLGFLVGPALWIGLLVLWILSLIAAANGEKKPTPILGEQFQEWFKTL